MGETISLPARLDGASVQAVADALRAGRGKPVTLDAGGVTAAGALGVQLLVAGRRQWQADDMPFRVQTPSDALLGICSLLGVDPVEIGAGPVAEDAK